MKPVNESWGIAEESEVPDWILDIESELAQAIKNQ
jgi:hypothetical protein